MLKEKLNRKDVEDFTEDLSMTFFGRSRSLAIYGGQCVKCGEFNLEFEDEPSRAEYGVTGLCQYCQKVMYNTLDHRSTGE